MVGRAPIRREVLRWLANGCEWRTLLTSMRTLVVVPQVPRSRPNPFPTSRWLRYIADGAPSCWIVKPSSKAIVRPGPASDSYAGSSVVRLKPGVQICLGFCETPIELLAEVDLENSSRMLRWNQFGFFSKNTS